MTAEPMPIARREVSGVSSTLAIARLAGPGKAANTRPSITKTSPSAARKSSMPSRALILFLVHDLFRKPVPTFRDHALSSRRGWRRRRFRARLARRIVEEAEETGVRLEQEPSVGMPEAGFVSLHRAVEREEVGVLVECVGEDLVAGGVALAADLLGLGGGIRHQHGHLAVGARADFLRALGALRAEFRRLALALGLHALIDRLAVLLRQVGAGCARRPPRCRSRSPHD